MKPLRALLLVLLCSLSFAAMAKEGDAQVVELRQYKLAEGCTNRELAEAMRAAMLAGKLSRAQVGKYANRTPMFGLVPT